MYLAVVGCAIFKNEIDFIKSDITSTLDFFWLPQKLHNKPLELRKLVQEEITKIDESAESYDAIVLLYGLCSKGTIGILSKKYRIVVPRMQDCIGLLLGSNDRYIKHFRQKPGTYWFTKGWIETGFDPGKKSKYEGVFDPYKERYREYRKKFTEELSRFLIDEWDQHWIQNYTTLAFIDWGIKRTDNLKKRAQKSAESMGLEFEVIEGDPGLLLDLLNGVWDSDNYNKDKELQSRYLIAEPGYKIIPSYSDTVLTCTEAESDRTTGARRLYRDKTGLSQKRTGIGLGIDAGGTYTDSVIYDFTKEEVIASAKALTTHDDYTVGINNSLCSLLEKVPSHVRNRIGLVSLSTTVATNAIVEGKGGKVGLVLIGYGKYSAEKIAFEPKVIIKGKHNIQGEVIEPIDEKEAKRAVKELLGKGIEAFAVSSEVGVRNPEFEQIVKEIIISETQMPVVCGSELTTEINCVKRANTCYFNARLIPLVTGLLSSVKNVLDEKQIGAPIMVVKGDGTLMGEDVAKLSPIDMVLSGPAASVIGGAYLSGIQDGYVVDMGGTTTDVACVEEGFVSFKDDGIRIGSFRTAVKTVNVHTFGLGGDSYVQYRLKGGKITVGPARVIPISYLAHLYPKIISLLDEKSEKFKGDEILVQPCDYFIHQKDVKGQDLHPQEHAILEVLKKMGPLSRTELSKRVGACSVAILRTDRLERYGNILRAALTPTDVLHALGVVSLWNTDAARKAVSLYAARAGMSDQELIDGILKEFYRTLIFRLFEFWFTEDGRLTDEEAFSANLASHLFFRNKEIHLSAEVSKPIVFIGAPAAKYAQGIKRLIDVDVIVPENHGVANAVGAITGAIREDITILIRPHIDGGYVAYTSDEKKYFETLSAAKDEMAELARKKATLKAQRSGALHVNADVRIEDKEVKISEDDTIYLETIVKASVSSIPVLKE
jgi:N-methylhydantoinase A/oxoprolinase/acetone carboxylase beta subunit